MQILNVNPRHWGMLQQSRYPTRMVVAPHRLPDELLRLRGRFTRVLHTPAHPGITAEFCLIRRAILPAQIICIERIALQSHSERTLGRLMQF